MLDCMGYNTSLSYVCISSISDRPSHVHSIPAMCAHVLIE